jgi:DNA-binding transcriptional LysR family regulator
MKRLLLNLPYFVEIARRKSFSRAAGTLNVPVSTLSRRMQALEDELGLKLLRRSTRLVEVTEAGQRLLEKSEYLLEELEGIRENLIAEQRSPSGKVRVSMTPDAYYLFLRGVFASFTRQYPEIEMQVYLSERWVDLAAGPVDLDIRGGEPPDSGLVCRRLTTVYPAIYASPKLLEKFPPPREPRDLKNIPFIFYTRRNRDSIDLQKADRTETIPVRAAHTVNSLYLSMEFALDGQGAAMMVPAVAEKYVEKGRLIRLVPEWRALGVDLNVVMAPGRLPNRVRLFVEHLVKRSRF